MYFLEKIIQDIVKAFSQKFNGAKIKSSVLKFRILQCKPSPANLTEWQVYS